MRPYEVMIIYRGDLADEKVKEQVGTTQKLIADKGAELGPTDYWGMRRFAYEIDHMREGYYAVFHTKADPEAMDAMTRQLNLSDEVIRHKVLSIPEWVFGDLTPGATVAHKGR